MQAFIETDPLFVRPSQAAAMLSLSRAKVYQLIAEGTLPSVRLGGSIRVPVSALRELDTSARATEHGKV
jgi:excisionase family DNA binding protein